MLSRQKFQMQNPSTKRKFFRGQSLSLKEILSTTSKPTKRTSIYSLQEEVIHEEFSMDIRSQSNKMDIYKSITSFQTNATEGSEKEQEKLRSLYDENPFFRELINTRSQKKFQKINKSKGQGNKQIAGRKETTTFKELKMKIIEKTKEEEKRLRAITIHEIKC